MKRERHVDVRWFGDNASEAAVMEYLKIEDVQDEQPIWECERWISVPVSQAGAVRAIIYQAGGRLL